MFKLLVISFIVKLYAHDKIFLETHFSQTCYTSELNVYHKLLILQEIGKES